ncbi:ClpXP adapter SpxH family protein [Pontibacter beigongshangensis]|uniref:ClpXP adapter SpxH family protein n=1 Tax=Pontibacter beigongshangensis TaxID=2574733 RepID=UPI001650CCD4|nr:ClpXP adapter SpxH family protein [Pontibacter beigongshangensis]
MDNQNRNPLLCDIETGICEIPTSSESGQQQQRAADKKPVRIIYFTDPICSSCWGIEPQLRKLKLEYGHDLQIEYHMGGLLPDWSYNSGGIGGPADVAHHWDEASAHYDMPIDGDVWLEDPLHSSYPPSVAFKAAQLQNEEKAVAFLRRTREMLFLEKKNITKWEHMSAAAVQVGLDPEKLKQDYEGSANDLFKADLELGRQLGVRGFPTLFFADGQNKQQTVYGFRPYEQYENAVLNLHPQATKVSYNKAWDYLFGKYPTLATREFAELSGQTKAQSEAQLQQLADQNKLSKQVTKNGDFWSVNTASN